MADYDIFREQLAIKYPSYGYALWEPSPANPNRPVQIGDVGFVREGRFRRLFSALRPADDPSQEFGVPEYHKPLAPTVSDHVDRVFFVPNDYCSSGVKVEADPGYHSSPDDFPQVLFQNETTRTAAVLSLPLTSRRENTLLRNVFGRWMVKHIDTWFAFARNLGLVHQMEEIILVTGCDLTRSWTNVTFLGGRADAQVSFGVEVKGPTSNPSINFQFSPGRVRGAVLHCGPEGTNLPENQCVFIRGFRVAPSIYFLPKRLKAAAGPSRDEGGYDCDSDVEAISIPAVTQFRDPLYLLSDYIAEQASDCDKILIHDDDLLMIDGIGGGQGTASSLETLEPDVMVAFLQKSDIKIYKSECDSFLTESQSGPNTDTSYVKVASVSIAFQDRNPTSPSQPSSPVAQKIDLSHNSEFRGTPQPTMPGSLSVTSQSVSTEHEPPLLLEHDDNAISTFLDFGGGIHVFSPDQGLLSAGHNYDEVSSGSRGLGQPAERSLMEVIPELFQLNGNQDATAASLSPQSYSSPWLQSLDSTSHELVNPYTSTNPPLPHAPNWMNVFTSLLNPEMFAQLAAAAMLGSVPGPSNSVPSSNPSPPCPRPPFTSLDTRDSRQGHSPFASPSHPYQRPEHISSSVFRTNGASHKGLPDGKHITHGKDISTHSRQGSTGSAVSSTYLPPSYTSPGYDYNHDTAAGQSNAGLPPTLWMSPSSTSPSTPSIVSYPSFNALTMSGDSSVAGNGLLPSLPEAHRSCIPSFSDSPLSPATTVRPDAPPVYSNIFSNSLFTSQHGTDATSSFPSPILSGSPDLQSTALSPTDASQYDPEQLAKEDPLATEVWKMYSRTKAYLPHAQRMENLTWRMMALALKKKKDDETKPGGQTGEKSEQPSVHVKQEPREAVDASVHVKQEPSEAVDDAVSSTTEETKGVEVGEERGRRIDKRKAKVSVVGFDGANQDGTEDDDEVVSMDWRAMSRSRSRVPMDWRPISRSMSRPSQAMGIQVDNAFSQPQRFTFPSLEHPSDSKPFDMHSPLKPSADDQLALNPSAPSSTSNIPNGSGRQNPTSLFAHETFPLPTLDAAPEQRSFPRRVRKTGFDHTVSKEGISAGILGRHQVNGRPLMPESIIGTKRPADASHAESMLRADPPSVHTSSPIVESPDAVQRFSLNHYPQPSSHHPSNGSFPSAPFNFTVPGYDGFFDLHATHSLPHDYPPILTATDGSRHVPSYHENPHSSLSTTPYSPQTNPPLTSDEGLSAAAMAASAAVADSYARLNLTVDEGGLEYPNMSGFMYSNGVEATNLSHQPFTHVDPTQILPVDHGENGFSSFHPSPSSDGWGNGFASSTAASRDASNASTPPSVEGSSNRQGVRKIVSTKRIQDAAVRSAIARKKSTVGSDPPPTAQLRSSTSTPDFTSLAKGGGPKSEDGETAPTVCTNCQTTNTPLWWRDPEGQPLCNGCRLFFKLHGVVRPLSLKTDVIKKRNRASGAPNAGARKNSVLPKLASSSTRPRSSTTSNTPLALPGSRLSPSSRMGAGAAVAGSLALKRQRRTPADGPGTFARKLAEDTGT